MPETTISQEERVVALLQERGINGIAALLAELEELGITHEMILTTIKWWDDLPPASKGTGLLVARLKDGGAKSYVRAHERTGVDGEIVVGPKELARIRQTCLTPDGISRDDICYLLEKLAAKANTTPASIVDSVMGERWVETPPHPANVMDVTHPADCAIRYEIWLRQVEPDRPNPEVERRKDEALIEWSMRYWAWKDPEDMAERRVRREIRMGLRAPLAAAPDPVEEEGHSAAPKEPEPAPQSQKQEDTAADTAVATEAPPDPELDERYGVDAPWSDEDLDPEDPW